MRKQLFSQRDDRKIVGVAIRTLCWLCMALIIGCSDVVNEHYDNYTDAVQAGLFERGWLPGILPDSATEIHASNQLDKNTAEGYFHLPEQSLTEFISRLTPVADQAASDASPQTSNNGKSFQYFINNDIWTFTIYDNGNVSYTLKQTDTSNNK